MRRYLYAFVFASALLLAGSAAAQETFGDRRIDILRGLEKPLVSPAGGQGLLRAPQPTDNQSMFDVLHYDVFVGIDEVTREVTGRVSMTALCTAGPLDSMDINADQVLDILSVEQASAGPASITRSGDVVSIHLPSPASSGDTVTVEILYQGFPYSAMYTGLYFRDYGTSTFTYSLSEPWLARTWWPCKDYPDDKATFDMELAVRDPLFAASNGNYIGKRDTTLWGEPFKIYQWRETYPMATYLFSISACEYVELTENWYYSLIDTMRIKNYVYPDLAADAAVDLEIQVPALQFLSQAFGMYPFVDEGYGIALAPIGGGMEHQTLCTYGHFFIRGDHSYDWLYVHELAHQWFGDATTCEDWTHIWLNEGWASYCEALWAEHKGGDAALASYMESLDQPNHWDGSILRDPDQDEPSYYFSGTVYSKAAWMLHMLRHIIGDAAFFGAARDYLQDPAHKYGSADTDAMIAAFENRYGEDLGWFFDEWLTRDDIPYYFWSWTSWQAPDGTYKLSIQVTQNTGVPYDMPVDFKFFTESSVNDVTLRVDDKEESFLLQTDALTTDVFFDTGHWLLCYQFENAVTHDETPPASFLAQNRPNPFNPSTRISFGLESASPVRLDVFDVRGALVATLVDRRMEAGAHEVVWNGMSDRGSLVSSGVYLYRLSTPSTDITRKMVLIR